MIPAALRLTAASLLDHLVGGDEDGLGERKPESLGGLEVDNGLEARRLSLSSH